MTQDILVVDDSEDLVTLYADILEMERYEVLTAIEPFVDVQEVADLQPDLIILDLLFHSAPDGWTMLHTLKAHDSTQHIPVLFATVAKHLVGPRGEQRPIYDVPVLYKPFTFDELLQQVQTMLGCP